MSAFDLTPKLTPFLDRHLLVPLLEFIATRDVYYFLDIFISYEWELTRNFDIYFTKIYPKDQVLGVLANVLSKTRLSNKKIEIAQQLNQSTAGPLLNYFLISFCKIC